MARASVYALTRPETAVHHRPAPRYTARVSTPSIPLSHLLWRTHTALVLGTAVGVSLPVGGLLWLTALLGDMAQDRSSLDATEAVHRASWAVEVAMRHGERACHQSHGDDEPRVRNALEGVRTALETQMQQQRTTASAPLLALAKKYQDLATRALQPGTCQQLDQLDAERLQLDEDMTDTWIDRMRDLNARLEQNQQHAGAVSAATAGVATAAGVLGIVLAAFLARRTGRTITQALGHAGAAAARVGHGDFAPVEVHRGIVEVERLTEVLERMRVDLAAADRVKQQFLASVSHELRTPLGRLREALGLLADGTAGPLTAQQERVLQLAQRACEREVRVVSTLLDLTRLQTGEPLRAQPGARVEAAIRSAVNEEMEAARERGVVLDTQEEGDSPLLALDLPLLETALANIIRNAVSVTPRGGRVLVSRLLRQTPAPTLCVQVADQGPGLPAALQNQPFKPFRPVDVAPDRPGGVGLGLALAHEVARAHGGDLRVLHTGPHGTTFEFALPLNPQGTSA